MWEPRETAPKDELILVRITRDSKPLYAVAGWSVTGWFATNGELPEPFDEWMRIPD
jgi:hypothetical protein